MFPIRSARGWSVCFTGRTSASLSSSRLRQRARSLFSRLTTPFTRTTLAPTHCVQRRVPRIPHAALALQQAPRGHARGHGKEDSRALLRRGDRVRPVRRQQRQHAGMRHVQATHMRPLRRGLVPRKGHQSELPLLPNQTKNISLDVCCSFFGRFCTSTGALVGSEVETVWAVWGCFLGAGSTINLVFAVMALGAPQEPRRRRGSAPRRHHVSSRSKHHAPRTTHHAPRTSSPSVFGSF